MFLKIIVLLEILHSFGTCQNTIKTCVNVKEMPYIVSVQRLDVESRKAHHWCTGSIISASGVILPAHCAIKQVMNYNTGRLQNKPFSPPELIVIVGASAIEKSTYVDRSPNTVKYVKEIIVHEFNTPELEIFDIALIKLLSPLEMTRKVQPILMPMPEMFEDLNPWDYFHEEYCFSTSYGKKVTKQYPNYDICVLADHVFLYNETSCDDLLEQLHEPRILEPNEICASTKRTTLCDESPSELLICGCHIFGLGSKTYCRNGMQIEFFSSIEKYYDWVWMKIGNEPDSPYKTLISSGFKMQHVKFLFICNLLSAMIG